VLVQTLDAVTAGWSAHWDYDVATEELWLLRGGEGERAGPKLYHNYFGNSRFAADRRHS